MNSMFVTAPGPWPLMLKDIIIIIIIIFFFLIINIFHVLLHVCSGLKDFTGDSKCVSLCSEYRNRRPQS